MASHLNISSTYDVTLPSGAEAQKVRRSQKIGTDKQLGSSGEYEFFDALHSKTIEVVIDGIGPAGLDLVTSASGLTAATLKKVKAEQKESNEGRASFTITASGHAAFDDSAGAATGGTEPDENTLVISSITHAAAQSLTKSTAVEDKVVRGSDGKPLLRGTCAKLSTFSVEGKGDFPSGLAVGSAQVSIAGLSGGKLIVTDLSDDQALGEWNGYSLSGEHCHAA